MRMTEDMINERFEACRHVEDVWTQCLLNSSNTVKNRDFRNVEDSEHMVPLHDAIWHASTEILPNLEVQAIVDSKNDIYVSTGTAGYVDYLTIDPNLLTGMKLPIKCWIHTHPFGAAYFSGTDWRTINIWKENMACAYVLGGKMSTDGHYGFWVNRHPSELEIYIDGEHIKTQKLKEEEE
tara:strand:- start:717 stop:1256 length:540 start_codon:yes stop_codon:yes gene_type:complete